MEQVSLSNGVMMPKAILGSFNVLNQSTINEMVKAAISEGMTGFDTSPSYGSERILGNALRLTGVPREHFFLTDKIDAWQMYKGKVSK